MPSEGASAQKSPRCRLMHFVSTFEIKTDTKWLVQLARYLDRGRFDLSAVCFYGGGPIQADLDALGVRTFNLDVADEHDLRAILRARRVMQTAGCDVAHTHLLRADLFAGAAARWAGVPVIVSTAYAIGQYRREKRRRTDRLLDYACTAMTKHTIAVSLAVAVDCIDRLKMDPRTVTIIHTGIDPPAQTTPAEAAEMRARLAVGVDNPLIVTVGRLSYEKGMEVLIDAAARVRNTHPNARFVIAGEGPDRSRLEDRIRLLNLEPTVRLLGFVPEVRPLWGAADVACIPSKSEGMPNVLLEAMAAGCPVVATNVGGIPEAIDPEWNGLLVRPDDPNAMAAAIRSLIDDCIVAHRLGEIARRTVHERFHVRDVVARYEALYQKLVTRETQPRAARFAISGTA